MKFSDALTALSLQDSNESREHAMGKARLVTLINSHPGLVMVFTSGDNEARLVGGTCTAEIEVGWPKVMPRCTFDSYRVKRGEPPDYIFDVGIFRDNELIGVCEMRKSSPTYLPKLAGVLRSGLFLVEIGTRDLERALSADRPSGIIHIPCAQVYHP